MKLTRSILIAIITILMPCLIINDNKLYAQLQLDWAKQLGGTAGDGVYDICVDNYGNVYTTGFFNGTADFDPGPATFLMTSQGDEDAYICKVDSYGNFLWAAQFGGQNSQQGYTIDLDQNGNIITTGMFQSNVDFDPAIGIFNMNASGWHDLYILKLDSNGNFMWAKQITGSSTYYRYHVALTGNNNITIGGAFIGTVDFDPSSNSSPLTSFSLANEDGFILQLDTNGDFLWVKQIEGYDQILIFAICTANDNSIQLVGRFDGLTDFDPSTATFNMTSFGGPDIFALKLDDNGNYEWVKQFGGQQNDYATEVVVDNSGNVYISGTFDGLIDVDPSQNILNITSNGIFDTFLAKLDSDGNLIFAKHFGGVGGEESYELKIDSANYIYVSGVFENTVDFNPGSGLFNLTSNGAQDIFIVKLDSSGNFDSAFNIGGTQGEQSFAFDIDNNGNLYSAGWFYGQVDFDPTSAVFNLSAQGQLSDIYVLKLKPINTSSSDPNIIESFILFPNPAYDQLIIKVNDTTINNKIRIRNLLGQVLLETELENITNKINIDNFSNGVYFVQLIRNDLIKVNEVLIINR